MRSGRQVPHSSKKSEEEKAASAASPAAPAANYDSLLIRNLQYVKGPDGRAKYAIATPVAAAAASADLVPSETDYHAAAGGDESAGAARKYTAVASAARAHNNAHAAASHDDPAARSFQVSTGAGLLKAMIGQNAFRGAALRLIVNYVVAGLARYAVYKLIMGI